VRRIDEPSASSSVREVTVDIRFLDGLEVRVSGSVRSLGGPQARVVFAMLAAEAGTVVAVARLIDELWSDDPPRDAVGTIQTHVATIRRGLGEERDRLRTRDGGYVLDVRPDELDVHRFVALVRATDELRVLDPVTARDRLESALSQWRGEPLVGLSERSPRLTSEARRLSELRSTTLDDFAELCLELGDHATAVAELERVVAAHPFRERSFGLLLRGLAAAGRRQEALTRYVEYRRRLVDEVGVDPSSELQRTHLELLGAPAVAPPASDEPDGSSAARVGSAAPVRLPAFRTRLFGREHDLEALAGLLDRERLVTITGVGGSGKTRLAVELCRLVQPRYPAGVHVVDLAPVRTGELVPATTARSLGVLRDPRGGASVDQIVRFIGDTRRVVMMDNCEHVIDACADHVRALLDDCQHLSVVATSRVPLALDGERLWRLDRLALPGDEAPGDAASLRMLTDRVRAVRPEFAVDDDNRAAMVTICEQLDGLPLAIELIAARFAHLSPGEVAARLAVRRAALLRGSRRTPRHRSMEAAIDWSYQLLDPTEQACLRRLAVFVGGADLDAVTAVAGSGGAEWETLDLLGSLVACSLLVVDEVDGCSRYSLLETIREFAGRRLREAGEEWTVRLAHRDHYLQRIEAIPWDRRMFSEQVTVAFEPELGNLRAAIRTSLDAGSTAAAARIALGCPALVIVGSHWDEYDRWLAELRGHRPPDPGFAQHLGPEVAPALVAGHLWIEGWRFAGTVEDIGAIVPVIQASASQLVESDPAWIFLQHMLVIGELWYVATDLEAGVERLLELAEAARTVGSELLHAVLVDNAGLFQLLAGEYEHAIVTLRRCSMPVVSEHYPKPLLTLGISQHLAGDHGTAVRSMQFNSEVMRRPEARCLTLLALALAVAGADDLASARELIRRARDELDRPQWHHPTTVNTILVIMGACAVLEGCPDVARRLLAAAGPTSQGFTPMTAVHVHYGRAAGLATGGVEAADAEEAGAAAGDADTVADLAALVDAELLRWARESAPMPSDGSRVLHDGLRVAAEQPGTQQRGGAAHGSGDLETQR
jgi:predicted ATPase/DNA-binding SARP family transcriptional activator